jgi:hypothetical protein
MKRFLYAPCVLAAGLLCAQLIATIHVYGSNLKLLKTTDAIGRHGYLPVPNLHVAQHLESLSLAMAGGLFFTLSIGAGLTLLTMTGVWSWGCIFKRSTRVALISAGLWGACLFLVNSNGWNPYATAYLTIVPLGAGICAIALLPDGNDQFSISGVLCPIAAAIVLALSWTTVLDKNLFTNVRDNLLLSNRLGESITNAYYNYTLYPAEAFKSLSQKQIRTCRLGDTIPRNLRSRLEKTLRIRDYLPVKMQDPVNLTIEQTVDGKDIHFIHHQTVLFRCSPQDFFRDPGGKLKAFSADLDRHKMFRKFTLAGLLFGLPLILFTLVFTMLKLLPGCFLPAVLSNIIAGLFCIGIGIVLLIPVYQGQRAAASTTLSTDDLNSPLPPVRLAVLKNACKHRRDISGEARKFGIAKSPNIAERYWFVRNLVYSTNRETSKQLLELIKDPAPIVACQALWAMGQRKDRSVIPEIVHHLQTSSHWYLQMYGYRALKALGWVQPRSPQNF